MINNDVIQKNILLVGKFEDIKYFLKQIRFYAKLLIGVIVLIIFILATGW